MAITERAAQKAIAYFPAASARLLLIRAPVAKVPISSLSGTLSSSRGPHNSKGSHWLLIWGPGSLQVPLLGHLEPDVGLRRVCGTRGPTTARGAHPVCPPSPLACVLDLSG